MDQFKTVKKKVETQIIEKKSKFIATIFPVNSKQEAEDKIKQVKKQYYDARHNCYAYRVIEEEKVLEKCSDDGEPSGTAGSPMLAILKNKELMNMVVIVTRYFGGILLGTGGLVRAYSEATIKSIMQAEILKKEIGEIIEIIVDYNKIEEIKYYCRKNKIAIQNEIYADNVKIQIEMSKSRKEKIIKELDEKNIKLPKNVKKCKTYISVNTNI